MQDSEDIWDDVGEEPVWKDLIGHPAWILEDPRTTSYQLRDPDYPIEKVAWTVGSTAVSAYRLAGGRDGRAPNSPALIIASKLRRLIFVRHLLGVPVQQLAAELEELRVFLRPLVSTVPNPEKAWFGAIAVLVRNDEAIKWAIPDHMRGHNFLFDSYCRSETISRDPVWADRHQGLLEAIDLQLAGEPDAASRRVFDYVDSEWYDEHEEAPWHGRRDAKMGGFLGYWCFEAAAINQIYGIDDTLLRGHRHYPTDLVDYFRATG